MFQFDGEYEQCEHEYNNGKGDEGEYDEYGNGYGNDEYGNEEYDYGNEYGNEDDEDDDENDSDYCSSEEENGQEGGGPVCKMQSEATNKVKSLSSHINKKLRRYKKYLRDESQKNINKIKKAQRVASETAKQNIDQAKNSYTGMSWRQKRPDVTMAVEIAMAVMFLALLYKLWPYLTGSAKPGFSKAQFEKATKLPSTAFSVEEVAKVNLEVKAFQDYSNYFKSSPYSLQNSGIIDLIRSSALLPVFLIFLQYVVPPYVIGYMIWFVIRFWPHVARASWGFFITMYDYFTTLATGKLGCKWYIRFITGWSCHSPNFMQYVSRWRRRYIDRPIYMERLKYIQKYYWARKTYYEIPYRKYITIPTRRYKVKSEFAKKIYVDRAIDVFLKKLLKNYPKYYLMPRDEFYRWLLGNNENLAALYAKVIQARSQIEGKSYKSITPSGRSCVCPASKTPVSLIKEAIQEQAEDISDDLDSLIKATNRAYDSINGVDLEESCEAVDYVIDKKRHIVHAIIIAILMFTVGTFAYSHHYGTPGWVRRIFAPANQFIYRGLSVAFTGSKYNTALLVYGLIAVAALGFIYFA